MRYLQEQEIRDIANGSAILGTGGGGDPYLGTLAAIAAIKEFGPPAILEVSELADDALVAFPFIVGSPVPGVEKFPFGLELVRAYRMLEGQLGRRITAVMSAEIGFGGQGLSARSTGQSGPNSTVPSTPLALPE